jgi:hypothetical protein
VFFEAGFVDGGEDIADFVLLDLVVADKEEGCGYEEEKDKAEQVLAFGAEYFG